MKKDMLVIKGPGQRTEIGSRILARGNGATLGSAKKPYDDFRKAQQVWATAQEEVKRAGANRVAAQARLAEAKAAFDASVKEFAMALVFEGASRFSPLKSYGAESPSRIASMGHADGVEAVQTLVVRVLAKKPIRTETTRSAKTALGAAQAVKAELGRVASTEAEQGDAIARRDALVPNWDAAFANLKWAAHLAEGQGALGLYARLFAAPSSSRRREANKDAGSSDATKSPPKTDAPPEPNPVTATPPPADPTKAAA